METYEPNETDKAFAEELLEKASQTDDQQVLKPREGEVDLDKKLACGFSRREILQMRNSGMDKPGMISWIEWNGPKRLSHRHMLIAHLGALGYTQKDIAMSTNMSQQRISLLMNTQEVKEQIKILREVELQGMGSIQKIDMLSSQAVRVYEQILFDPDVKMILKQRAAQDILDRKLGKPQQKIEHTGSLVKEFYQMLNERKDPEDLAGSPRKVLTAPLEAEAFEPDFDDFIEAGPPEAASKEEAKPLPQIDSWIKENT